MVKVWTARVAVGLLVLACIPARAERRRLRIGVQPIYALAFVDGRSPSGGGVGADVAYNVTDGLALRATGFVAFHELQGVPQQPGGTVGSFGAFAGLTYALDIVRIVPSFDVGLGVLGLRGDARFTDAPLLPSVTALAVELGFGFDWLITHRWSMGAVVRYHAMLTSIERSPSFLYVGPRVSLTLP